MAVSPHTHRLPWLLLLVLAPVHCGDDAGPPTDEELLEGFVIDVTGIVDAPMMTRSLRYVDIDNLPLDVSVPQHQGVYRADRKDNFTKRYLSHMRRQFGGSEIKVRSHKIDIEGTEAKVKMRLMTARGPIRVRVELRKMPNGWKVSRVHAEPGL